MNATRSMVRGVVVVRERGGGAAGRGHERCRPRTARRPCAWARPSRRRRLRRMPERLLPLGQDRPRVLRPRVLGPRVLGPGVLRPLVLASTRTWSTCTWSTCTSSTRTSSTRTWSSRSTVSGPRTVSPSPRSGDRAYPSACDVSRRGRRGRPAARRPVVGASRAGERVGRLHEAHLHVVRRERRVLLEHERRGARDDGRRGAGAGEHHVRRASPRAARRARTTPRGCGSPGRCGRCSCPSPAATRRGCRARPGRAWRSRRRA